MIFVCSYLRFKQCLNMIWRKLAVLSLNTVKTQKGFGFSAKNLAENKKNRRDLNPRNSGFLDVCTEALNFHHILPISTMIPSIYHLRNMCDHVCQKIHVLGEP